MNLVKLKGEMLNLNAACMMKKGKSTVLLSYAHFILIKYDAYSITAQNNLINLCLVAGSLMIFLFHDRP